MGQFFFLRCPVLLYRVKLPTKRAVKQLLGSVLTIRTALQFDEIPAFYRNLRGLNLREYAP